MVLCDASMATNHFFYLKCVGAAFLFRLSHSFKKAKSITGETHISFTFNAKELALLKSGIGAVESLPYG